VIVYAESSAVLTWLLGEPGERHIRALLGAAERIVSSSLTAVECARAVARGAAAGRLTGAQEHAALRILDQAVAGWIILDLTGPVLARARARFPREPVRTLDALHLATAAQFHQALGAITMVSLDQRIRANAVALGLGSAP